VTSAITIAAALAEAAAELAKAGLPAPRREARLLLGIVLDVEPLHMLAAPDRILHPADIEAMRKALRRRLEHEPASRIRGRREFWSLDFVVTPDVLDPRPETELLVARALEYIGSKREHPLRILDIGTGSGCILIALLHELPAAFGVGLDRSLAALRVARVNAEQLGVADRSGWAQGSWLAPIGMAFDLIVANPPYIPTGVLETLDHSVSGFDPPMALDGGPDGFVAFRALIQGVGGLMRQGGAAFLEVGQGQAGSVAEIGKRHGFKVQTIPDLAGIPRCVALFPKFSACNKYNRS
jgi:release factor glutamine methyltransferase